jgi:hypothetical protein
VNRPGEGCCLLDDLPTPCVNAFSPTCHCEPFSKLSEQKARQSTVSLTTPHHPEIASSLHSSP